MPAGRISGAGNSPAIPVISHPNPLRDRRILFMFSAFTRFTVTLGRLSAGRVILVANFIAAKLALFGCRSFL
jgi:hypothetical protein